MRQTSIHNGYSTASFKDPKSRDYEVTHEPRVDVPESTYDNLYRNDPQGKTFHSGLNNNDRTVSREDVDGPYEK